MAAPEGHEAVYAYAVATGWVKAGETLHADDFCSVAGDLIADVLHAVDAIPDRSADGVYRMGWAHFRDEKGLVK